MKFATVTKSLVLALALFIASSAFAAAKATIQLHNVTTVNGTQLKPGEYKLQWDGSGPSVEVSILQGKNVVTKVQAKLVDLDYKPANDAAVTKKNDDGSVSLTGIRFEGKKTALQIGDSGDGMQGSAK
jgi:hypothetical protein